MLDIIDEINNSELPQNLLLVSFDVVNMFPNINNEFGINYVKQILEERETKTPPTQCIIEALTICLECNNSIFNNKYFLQVDGTAQGPHMACSYSEIAMAYFDKKSLTF